jgi:hypothetical protein
MTTEILAPGSSLDGVAMTMREALDRTWKTIRRRHPDVPPATIQIVPGRGSTCGTVVWDSAVIAISARTLQEAGPREILNQLLHQAAHGLMVTRGLEPVTSEAKYHNTGFRDAAQQLGLEVSFATRDVGWKDTAVSDHLARQYADVIGLMGSAVWEPPAVTTGHRNFIAARCQCDPPRPIRVGKKTLDKGAIRCEVCGQPFEP